MTLTEAIEIRARQLNGKPVLALELQEAIAVINENRPRPKGGRAPKFRLPAINPVERMRVNAVLLYRLGLALGRIEERKAA